MNAVDMATSVIMFIFAFSFINYGIASASTIALLIGFYVFMYFIGSLIVLQYQRVFNETEYLEQFGKGSYMPSFKNIRNDLGGLLVANVKELFSMNASPILIVIFIVLYGIYYITGALKTNGSFYFMSIPFALFFLAWYLTILIKHFWYVYDKNNMAKTPTSVPSNTNRP